MADNDLDLLFYHMSEAEMHQWVEANPARVNDTDPRGDTPVHVAVVVIGSASLVLWLVKEKGADVNAVDPVGNPPLVLAISVDVLNALLDCGADPIVRNVNNGCTPVMTLLKIRRPESVARLLQDPRVRASINLGNDDGSTILHYACHFLDEQRISAIVQLLLQAGADLTLKNAGGQTPVNWLEHDHPTHPTTLALVAQSLDAEKASFLIKARRLVMAATRTTPPSFLQGRMAHEVPFPRITLAPVTDAEDEEGEEDEEARRELRTMLTWLVGVEGGGGMPRDVFRVVLDLLMPFWDPLRRKAQAPPQM